MCFAKGTQYKNNLRPKYNTEDSTVNDENTSNTSSTMYIPEEMPEHVDSPFLDRNVDTGILAIIYENSDEILIVWTSDEAYEYIEQL